MAKYCIQCGKPLEKGKECSCNLKKEMDLVVQIKNTVRKDINLFLEIGNGMLKTPIDTIKKYAIEQNFQFGMITILINAILFGLFFYCLLKERADTNFFHYWLIGMNVSFIKSFLFGVVEIIVAFGIMITMITTFTSLLKSKVSFKSVTVMTAICSIIMTIAFTISLVFIFLSFKLVFLILLVSSLFYLTYLSFGILEITKINKNKLAYVFVPSICVTLFVVVYIVPKILF